MPLCVTVSASSSPVIVICEKTSASHSTNRRIIFSRRESYITRESPSIPPRSYLYSPAQKATTVGNATPSFLSTKLPTPPVGGQIYVRSRGASTQRYHPQLHSAGDQTGADMDKFTMIFLVALCLAGSSSLSFAAESGEAVHYGGGSAGWDDWRTVVGAPPVRHPGTQASVCLSNYLHAPFPIHRPAHESA